jgi:di/tricarboxylate transporter
MTGFTRTAQELLLGSGLGPGGVLLLMVLVWFVLGCLIDSISIMLLTVPIFAPIAAALGFDPLAFAIIGIVAIETGLLTPPFGLLVFTVKAAIQDLRRLHAVLDTAAGGHRLPVVFPGARHFSSRPPESLTALQRRKEDSVTPTRISATPAKWYQAGYSPRNSAASATEIAGIRCMVTPARAAPILFTT